MAEVGFLLLVIAGIWLAASQFQQPRWRVLRTVVAGVAIAAGGVLLLVAVPSPRSNASREVGRLPRHRRDGTADSRGACDPRIGRK